MRGKKNVIKIKHKSSNFPHIHGRQVRGLPACFPGSGCINLSWSTLAFLWRLLLKVLWNCAYSHSLPKRLCRLELLPFNYQCLFGYVDLALTHQVPSPGLDCLLNFLLCLGKVIFPGLWMTSKYYGSLSTHLYFINPKADRTANGFNKCSLLLPLDRDQAMVVNQFGMTTCRML